MVRSTVPVLLLLFVFSLGEAGAVAAEPPKFAPVPSRLVRSRDGLGHVLARLETGQPVRIGYLGGSITAAAGWRVQSLDWFRKTFPKAEVDEINAAIGGTGSDLGVFRLERDALRHKPDLLFVEFAVNDGGAPPERIWQAMEGIVRQTWITNPHTDICFVYTFRTGYEKELREGTCPAAASAMEQLADHYGIPSVNFAQRIVEQEKAGKLIFQSETPTAEGVVRFSSDGVHPLDEGHRIYTEVLAEAIGDMKQDAKPADHQARLATPFVENHWESAKMVPLEQGMLSGDWKPLPPENSLAKSFGERMGTLWEAAEPGSKLTFRYRGQTARLYDLLGPDGGQVIITVDGKTAPKPVPRFDSYCTYHRIATLSLAEGTAPQETHTITIEIHPDQPDRQPVAFRLKDPETELKSPKYQGTNIRASQILLLGDLVRE